MEKEMFVTGLAVATIGVFTYFAGSELAGLILTGLGVLALYIDYRNYRDR